MPTSQNPDKNASQKPAQDCAQSTDVFLQWLKTQIPLLNHMGLGDLEFDGSKLRLPAALAPNINDKGTGFGGSLATLATISGWCLTTLLLRDRFLDCDVMIRDCEMRYLAPVNGDFHAEVSLPDTDQVDGFLARLKEKGRARLALDVSVIQDGRKALTMQGNYVAIVR
ncbi:YiiD C-terminal domain-containing protein [Neptunomonas qingdaonensis]|uniref:Thioesterase domain-containing protein, putative n=1 Tax=Neptunomonas qingdaonensis TaxID=1045558 RepID=A0A1I2P188_9GAMM|nr:YiiD C-terminal domain-containing protein [Neptunomonas qingdaonensis]SFG07667.1 thioesterase domain-containing protein, putative [Neptunomonas qingdaonensis]